MLFGINLNVRLRAQRAQQHALHLALFRFRGSQDALPHLLGHQRMVAGELLQRTAAQQIRAAVSHVRDAQPRALDPGRGQRRAHAVLVRVFVRRLENFLVGQVRRAGKTLGLVAPVRLLLAVQRDSRVLLPIDAVLHHRLHRQRARDFAVGFSTHAVREHEQVQRRHNAEVVLVVGAHAPHIGHAATDDLHGNSPFRAGHTQPARVAGNPALTLTDPMHA